MLEAEAHLQWFSWWREEVKEIAREYKVRGGSASKDQLLGEGHLAEVEARAEHDEEALTLMSLGSLKWLGQGMTNWEKA